MDLIEYGLIGLIVFLLGIVGILTITRFILPYYKERKRRKEEEKPFRIKDYNSKKEMLRDKAGRVKKELKTQTRIDICSVIHIDENSGIHLVVGEILKEVNKKRILNYKANGVEFKKTINEAYFLPLRYKDNYIEKVLLCDHYGTSNLKVDSPKLDGLAKHFYSEYLNMIKDLEIGYVDRSILAMDKKQSKLVMMMFIAGAGICSIFWVGAIVVFFFV
jgi:hypothetical protein